MPRTLLFGLGSAEFAFRSAKLRSASTNLCLCSIMLVFDSADCRMESAQFGVGCAEYGRNSTVGSSSAVISAHFLRPGFGQHSRGRRVGAPHAARALCLAPGRPRAGAMHPLRTLRALARCARGPLGLWTEPDWAHRRAASLARVGAPVQARLRGGRCCRYGSGSSAGPGRAASEGRVFKEVWVGLDQIWFGSNPLWGGSGHLSFGFDQCGVGWLGVRYWSSILVARSNLKPRLYVEISSVSGERQTARTSAADEPWESSELRPAMARRPRQRGILGRGEDAPFRCEVLHGWWR